MAEDFSQVCEQKEPAKFRHLLQYALPRALLDSLAVWRVGFSLRRLRIKFQWVLKSGLALEVLDLNSERGLRFGIWDLKICELNEEANLFW